MPRRTPAEFRLLVVGRGRQPVLEDFWDHVLKESERKVGNQQLRVTGKRAIGVIGGAKAVHQQERDICFRLSSQGQHLARDEIEKIQIVANREQGLRALEAHRCPEAAVELDDDRPGHG